MGYPLAIGHRGLLRCYVNAWRTVAGFDGPLPFPAMAVGRVVLETLHDKLFTAYDQIDVDAILARWRAPDPADPVQPPSTEEETLAIAASIAAGGAVIEKGRRAGRIASSLRLSEMKSLLEGKFGCTSRSSKGSEMVFYREGGRHAIVSRHKANPMIPAIAIQRMLKKLGIGVHEWLDVACR